jgi:Domain of unknown function (DUF4129)
MAPASGAALASTGAPETDPTRAVGSALGKGSFPWYDAPTDQAKPITLPGQPGRWGSAMFASVFSLIALVVALAALIALVIWLWRMYAATDSDESRAMPKVAGGPSRIESLPEGMRREFESSDPWEEAIRRRARGDLAGAVVCLFAHQLLTLSRLGLVRLAPGRTGRQLLRSVADAEFRALVHPTLRLFEAVYYGHRVPSPEEFASLWEQAEAFERRVAGGVLA